MLTLGLLRSETIEIVLCFCKTLFEYEQFFGDNKTVDRSYVEVHTSLLTKESRGLIPH